MTTALTIYFILGALAFRNHYLSINHPNGVYYQGGYGWDSLDKIIGVILFFLPIVFVICFYERPNGYNWRKKS